ncbi:MAG TPA: Mur ligase family protein, partial [Rectinemataceae bacterium]|nr:Mur ligase family protein [Rectinemataceae bacterium]
MNKSLTSLLASVKTLETICPSACFISGIGYDSRKVRKGDLFCALPGIHSDGNSYIDAAIARGAAAILHETTLDSYLPGIGYARVSDARAAMSEIAAAFHDYPSAALCIIGVTGTEGKSTTVSLIYQLLNLAGFKTGFFSTVMSDTGSGERPNPEHQTTPEATTVQEMLAAMRDSGCRYAVVESSSHGLSSRTGRLSNVEFDAGIMTNVTHEHLEFHG